MASNIPRIAYRFNNVLYVALTNNAVGRSLLELRGPGYRLPTESRFQALPDDVQVTADAVDEAVDAANSVDQASTPFGTVFAGHLGDPLLELDTMVSARPMLTLRVCHGTSMLCLPEGEQH